MKYHSRKTLYDGIVFDSKKEAQRYAELKMLERGKVISELTLQPEFELIPAQYEYYERYSKNGKRLKDGRRCIEKNCVYKADFAYTQDGKRIVEDVKGVRTKDYIIKRKLFRHLYSKEYEFREMD